MQKGENILYNGESFAWDRKSSRGSRLASSETETWLKWGIDSSSGLCRPAVVTSPCLGSRLLIEAASPASMASNWPSLITWPYSRFMALIRRISGALSANGRKRAEDFLKMTTSVLKNKIKMWFNNRLIKCLSNLSGVCIQNLYFNS